MLDTIEALAVIVASVIFGFNKYNTTKKSKYKPADLLAQAKKDGRIYAQLHAIRNEFRARRVYLTQFRNGGYYFSGEGIKTMSITHEVYDFPLHAIKDLHQNIPLDINLQPYLENLTKYHIYTVRDVSLLEDSAFKHDLQFRGAKSIYKFLLIHPKTKTALGIVTLGCSTINGLNTVNVAGVRVATNKLRDILIEC